MTGDIARALFVLLVLILIAIGISLAGSTAELRRYKKIREM